MGNRLDGLTFLGFSLIVHSLLESEIAADMSTKAMVVSDQRLPAECLGAEGMAMCSGTQKADTQCIPMSTSWGKDEEQRTSRLQK